jgi:poly(A) polymerase
MSKAIFKYYEVGGAVRDEIIGVKSKDIDYSVVADQERLTNGTAIEDVFSLFVEDIKLRGFEIFIITPRTYTVRAKMPAGSITADFVLARKETGYIENTRYPVVVPGTLHDDLSRRDFTMNAIAKDPTTGKYIDPFNGIQHIKDKILHTPIDGAITFSDDPLRLLRAVRFAVTRGFAIDHNIQRMLHSFDYDAKFGVVSEERIREELYKCFKYDTLRTLNHLSEFFKLRNYIFKRTNLWLKPTNEKQ